MEGVGNKLLKASEGMEQAQAQQQPQTVGIREYAQRLQESQGKDIPQKQLSVLEQIYNVLSKERPDLVQQQMGAVFQ
jgi:hypothetical protein